MTHQNQLNYELDVNVLSKRILTGILASVLLLAIFLISFGEPHAFIYIAALTTSLAGAGSGVLYYILCDYLKSGGIKMILARVICAILFLLTFWLGIVFALGQVGLWD